MVHGEKNESVGMGSRANSSIVYFSSCRVVDAFAIRRDAATVTRRGLAAHVFRANHMLTNHPKYFWLWPKERNSCTVRPQARACSPIFFAALHCSRGGWYSPHLVGYSRLGLCKNTEDTYESPKAKVKSLVSPTDRII